MLRKIFSVRGASRLITGALTRSSVGLLAVLLSAVAQAACPFVQSAWDGVNDGLVLTRYALGVTGSALNANTRYASTDPAQLRSNLDTLRASLDMNGDGQFTTIDSQIVTRYLLGFRDAALTANIALGSGSRTTNAAIVAFIANGCPVPVSVRTPIYEALQYIEERNSLLTQVNAQGARGFQFLGGLVSGGQFFNLYAKDSNATFTYEALDTPTQHAALLAQLNSQGARGFRFDLILTSGMFYVKDNSASLTYQYELPADPGSSAAFLTQANAQGARGYYFSFTYMIAGANYALYAKESSAATYQYELHPSTDVNFTPEQFVAQANTQGARGFKYTTGFFFSDGARNIYVKDTSQSASFEFAALATGESPSALVTQANAQGQINFVFAGASAFFPDGYAGAAQMRNIYFKPVNCSGSTLCSAGLPF